MLGLLINYPKFIIFLSSKEEEIFSNGTLIISAHNASISYLN